MVLPILGWKQAVSVMTDIKAIYRCGHMFRTWRYTSWALSFRHWVKEAPSVFKTHINVKRSLRSLYNFFGISGILALLYS
jgi:hypothetical protein